MGEPISCSGDISPANLEVSTPLLLTLMLACADPWLPLEAAEARWQRAEDIEADQGLQLAALSGGEPLGHWPRLVIRMDGIDFDNRAWVLSLDDELLRSLDEDQRRWLVKDQPGIMPLSEGVAAPAAVRGRCSCRSTMC